MALFQKYFILICATLFVWHINYLRLVDGKQTKHKTRSPSSQLRTAIDIKEKIVEWQCHAKCSTSKEFSVSFETCLNECRIKTITSPRTGQCPSPPVTMSTEESYMLQKLGCFDECHVDFDCAETKKCCDSICGPRCLDAIGISEDELPPIPKIMHLRLPKGHKVEVTIQTSANSTIYYHVETRYHIGIKFAPRKLSVWHWQRVEMTAEEILENRRKRIQICFNLKPGRWYQVRVAAINANGFRGYSEPSEAFKLSRNATAPMPPTDLQVVGAYYNGKHYEVKIMWCPSKSNLPIEKYKIIWSLYVHSKEESLISNEAYVRDTQQFDIQNLLPDSSYYIQVLATAISGRRRLKSDKKSILFNTTSTTLQIEPFKCYISMQSEFYNTSMKKQQLSLQAETKTKLNATTYAYDVRFRLNRKFGMIVQISGFQPNKEKIYELCSNYENCEHREYSAIRAKKNTLEFIKLKYNTTYYLRMTQLSDKSKDFVAEGGKSHYTFTTPKCENFRKRFPKMQIQC